MIKLHIGARVLANINTPNQYEGYVAISRQGKVIALKFTGIPRKTHKGAKKDALRLRQKIEKTRGE